MVYQKDVMHDKILAIVAPLDNYGVNSVSILQKQTLEHGGLTVYFVLSPWLEE